MSAPRDFNNRVLRAEVKQAVSEQLARLDGKVREDVVLELLAEIAPATLRALGRQSAEEGPKDKKGPASGSRGKTETVLETLRETPGTSIHDLAMAAYGDTSADSTSKVRSILASLKRQKKVRKIGRQRGKWRAV